MNNIFGDKDNEFVPYFVAQVIPLLMTLKIGVRPKTG